MIGCDLARAALVVVLAIPGAPVWAAIALLFAIHLFTPPFVAARSALLPEIFDGDQYIAALGGLSGPCGVRGRGNDRFP